MSDNDSQAVNDADDEASWPRKLNKALIGVGVIAFGLIITDRIVNMFQADDLPEVAEINRSQEEVPQSTQELEEPVVSVASVESQATPATTATTAIAVGTESVEPAPVSFGDSAIAIEDVFSSPLVFVSASEPQFVVTEDERRIDLYGSIDEQTKLAGITSQQLIIERDGNMVQVDLPDLQAD